MGEVKQSSNPDSQPLATASSPAFQSHPTRAERYAMGKSLREKCPRASHAVWQPAADRANPVSLVLKADEGRVPNSCPCTTGGWSCLPSPSTGARHRHGGGSDVYSNYRPPRAMRRRFPPGQLPRAWHPGKASNLRHQRPRRDPPRTLGMGHQASCGELRDRLSRQRPQQIGCQGCGPHHVSGPIAGTWPSSTK